MNVTIEQCTPILIPIERDVGDGRPLTLLRVGCRDIITPETILTTTTTEGGTKRTTLIDTLLTRRLIINLQQTEPGNGPLMILCLNTPPIIRSRL
jgi:hypothetical protein